MDINEVLIWGILAIAALSVAANIAAIVVFYITLQNVLDNSTTRAIYEKAPDVASAMRLDNLRKMQQRAAPPQDPTEPAWFPPKKVLTSVKGENFELERNTANQPVLKNQRTGARYEVL